MTKSDRKKATILSNLNNVSDKGIALYLSGKAATPEEIADCCLLDGVYMPDYVLDDKGSLKEIRYDKVLLN